MKNISDAALVHLALSGDRDAFCDLVRRYQNLAYGTAMGLLSDFDLAQDVAQESFLCAYEHLTKLKEPGLFAPWLRGIVRRQAYHAIRDIKQARSLVNQFHLTVEPFANTPEPGSALHSSEQRAIVREALERLDPKNREVVSLYYLDDMSYAEVAEFLGVTETTVKGRLQRGRHQLRKELKMVEETFNNEKLPKNFAEETGRLLDALVADCVTGGLNRRSGIDRLVALGPDAVPALCDALHDKRRQVRFAAVEALAHIGDPRAAAPVIDAAERTGMRTSHALRVPGVREAMLEVLRTKTGGGRWLAMCILEHARGDDEVHEAFLRIFRDYNSWGCASAMGILCDMRPESARDLILEALNGPPSQLHAWAIWHACSRHHFLPPLDLLRKGLEATSMGAGMWPGRISAGEIILLHGGPGRKMLREILEIGTPEQRATAAVALARVHVEGDATFDELLEEVQRPVRNRRWAQLVASKLAWHYLPRLLEWVESDPKRLAEVVPLLPGLINAPLDDLADQVIDVLKREGSPRSRGAIVEILGRIKGPDALAELRQCLRDGKPGKAARAAFWQMLRYPEAALPMVREMLSSEHWTERRAAVGLLRRWGKMTEQEREQARQDPHPAVHIAAG